MKIFWTPEALEDRAAIWNYISEENPNAAIRLDTLFSRALEKLSEHPQIGRQGLITGTRELIPHKNFRLVYEIDHDTVWILALVHVSRMWPP